MIKKNEQAKVHVESKHSGKKFEECFPGFTCGYTVETPRCLQLLLCLKSSIM